MSSLAGVTSFEDELHATDSTVLVFFQTTFSGLPHSFLFLFPSPPTTHVTLCSLHWEHEQALLPMEGQWQAVFFLMQ